MRRAARIFGISVLSLAGCATAPPTGALSAASAAMGAAHEAGAESAATAQEELTAARQELDQARALINSGDNQAAYGLLVRAKADADLATLLAREEHLRTDADQLTRQAEALRSQTHF